MKLNCSVIGHHEFTAVPDGIYTLTVKAAEIRPSSKGERVYAKMATERGAIVCQSWPTQGDSSQYLEEFVAAVLGEGVVLEDTDQLVGKTLTASVRTRDGLTNVFPRGVKHAAKPAAKPAEPSQPSDDAPVTE